MGFFTWMFGPRPVTKDKFMKEIKKPVTVKVPKKVMTKTHSYTR
jgi:hypothetical protein